MSAIQTKSGRQYGWLIGLAILSLVIPMIAIFFRNEPLGAFADPARLSYYRQSVVAVVLGLACALSTFAGGRTVPSSGLHRWAIGLASTGMLLCTYLLWTLIGNCGLHVLWGTCQP